jgi:hypothetical protein
MRLAFQAVHISRAAMNAEWLAIGLPLKVLPRLIFVVKHRARGSTLDVVTSLTEVTMPLCQVHISRTSRLGSATDPAATSWDSGVDSLGIKVSGDCIAEGEALTL